MKSTYQPVTSVELKTVAGPRPGAQAIMDAVLWHYHSIGAKDVRSFGIYNRRAIRGKKILTVRTASLHAAGRALDIGVTSKKRGDEICLRLLKAADFIGVCEIIWDRKRYTAKGTLPYRGVDPHTTHLHVGVTIDFASRKNTADLRKWVSHFMFEA